MLAYICTYIIVVTTYRHLKQIGLNARTVINAPQLQLFQKDRIYIPTILYCVYIQKYLQCVYTCIYIYILYCILFPYALTCF